jgi:hypothetical protein
LQFNRKNWYLKLALDPKVSFLGTHVFSIHGPRISLLYVLAVAFGEQGIQMPYFEKEFK